MLALTLTFGLVVAAAATLLLATLEPAGGPSQPSDGVRKRSAATPRAAEPNDEISEESREALREILREVE
jgi:hypothetical protein